MGNNPPFPCGGRPENLPLNPNSSTVPIAKPSHFDPISSLAQMSQQLTSNAGALNGQPQGPQGGPNMMGGFVPNNGMMPGIPDMGLGNMDASMGGMVPNSMEYGMHPSQYGMGQMPGPPRPMSPKIGGAMPNQMGGFPGPNPMSRMMNRPQGMNPYNGTNIQVKPSAPNTIQYLPARPQVSNTNPRGPPSLEFLQRFANPMNMDEMKPGNQQQMPFFPNQQNSGMNPNMNPNMMDEPGMMNPNMMRGMRGNNHQMMRFPGPGNGGNHCMMGGGGGNNTFNNPNMEQMFPGQPGNSPGMSFVPKGSPGPMQMNPNQVPTSNSMNNMNSMNSMNGPGPEQMQQMQMNGPGLPAHHFQKQQYSGGGPGSDPNYAQQYHNFQQQLYATNNSRTQQMMGGPQHQQQQQFIMPK